MNHKESIDIKIKKLSIEILSEENEEITEVCKDNTRCAFGYMTGLALEHQVVFDQLKNSDIYSDKYITAEAHRECQKFYLSLTNMW